jgi:hypothetical protein
VHLVKNIHVGTLKIRNWEKNMRKTGQSITNMQALIHCWNTPTIFSSNKTMDPLQKFVFPSHAKQK